MCLIVFKRDNQSVFTNKQFKYMIARNRDGVGTMWLEGKGDKERVRIAKSVGTNAEKFKLFQHVRNMPTYVMHARLKTHGLINEANCHPYELLNKDKGDPIDLYMMHNGVLGDAPSVDKDMSDTWHFVEYILKPIAKADPDLLWENEYIQKMITKVIGGSKLVMMRTNHPQFNILTFNPGMGTERTGCWLSNNYGCDPVVEHKITHTTTHHSINRTYASGEWQPGYEWDNVTRKWYAPKTHYSEWGEHSQEDYYYNNYGATSYKEKDLGNHNKIYLPDSSKDDKIVEITDRKKIIFTPPNVSDKYLLTCALHELRSMSDATIKDYMRQDPDQTADIIMGLYSKNTMTYETIVGLIKTTKGLEEMVNLIHNMQVIEDKVVSQ